MDLIDCRIKAWWPVDKRFYGGVVKSYDSERKKYVVLYDDGDVEVLRLDKERWEFVDNGRKPTKRLKSSKGPSKKGLSLMKGCSKDIVPSAERFILLYSLKRNLLKKVMVFFSSCNSVKFHFELLRYIHVDYFDIHGKQKQQKRTSTFFDFCKVEKSILLCIDVAAWGLDIPAMV